MDLYAGYIFRLDRSHVFEDRVQFSSTEFHKNVRHMGRELVGCFISQCL